MESDYYDMTARNYNELYGEEQARKIDFIKNRIVIPDDYLVLDVGCGSGLSSALTGNKKNIIGIDPSIELLKQNKNHCVCAYAESLPFKNKTFDAVISLTAIQNFSDIKKGLEEIKRVGKDFFILTILKRSQKVDDTRKLIKQIFNKKQDEIKFRVEELEEEKDIVFIIN
jgi:ubiquinone/menaquinone biosynthesis C-methylase UbiE